MGEWRRSGKIKCVIKARKNESGIGVYANLRSHSRKTLRSWNRSGENKSKRTVIVFAGRGFFFGGFCHASFSHVSYSLDWRRSLLLALVKAFGFRISRSLPIGGV